jgi:hypothetical protein
MIRISDLNHLLQRVGLPDRVQEREPIWPAFELIVEQLVKRIERLEREVLDE